MRKVNALLQDVFLSIAMVAIVITYLLLAGCQTLEKSKVWQKVEKSGKVLENQAGELSRDVDDAAAKTIGESTDNLIEIINAPN